MLGERSQEKSEMMGVIVLLFGMSGVCDGF